MLALCRYLISVSISPQNKQLEHSASSEAMPVELFMATPSEDNRSMRITDELQTLLQDVVDLLADKAGLSISPDIDFGLHQLTDPNMENPSAASSTSHSGASPSRRHMHDSEGRAAAVYSLETG